MAWGLVVLLLVVLSGGAALAVAAREVTRRRLLLGADAEALPGIRALRRTSLASRALAAAVGMGAAVLVASLDPLGRGLALAPAVVAVAQLVGVLVAEAVTHDAVRVRGRAGVAARRLRDFPVPVALCRAVAGASVLLVGVLAWASAAGSPDDLGRAGRSFAYTCAQGCDGGSRGPWPGSFYSVPVALGLGVVVVLALVAVRVVVQRPRNGGDPQVVRLDDVIRRRSLESVLASVGFAVGGTLTGVGAVVAVALVGAADLPTADRVTGWFALVAALAGLGLSLWSLVVLALPGAGAVAGAGGRVVASTGAEQQDPVAPGAAR